MPCSTYEPLHEKGYIIVFRFVVLQMRTSSPIFGQQACVFCPKLPEGLYYTSANSKGSGEIALMRRLA